MLIHADFLKNVWGIKPDRILHVGAHHAEELEDYCEQGWGDDFVYWVEALPVAISQLERRLRDHPKHRVINAVAWSSTGEDVAFKVTNNEQSSSALSLDEHLIVYPEIVVNEVLQLRTTALRDAIPVEDLKRLDFVNLDIQGAELRALQGFEEFLGSAQAVYSEVNVRSLYKECATFSEMKVFLAERGFRLVDWELLADGWGDALWLRKDLCPRLIWCRRNFRRLRYRARQALGVLSRHRPVKERSA